MQEHEVELHGLHQTVLNKISTFPKGNILDVGAGKGEFAQKLVAIGYDVEACDITPEPPWSRRLGVTYRQCDLNLGGLPFGDESFDYVVCIEDRAYREPFCSLSGIETGPQAWREGNSFDAKHSPISKQDPVLPRGKLSVV
jgi:SAM-dependent methyltransferase